MEREKVIDQILRTGPIVIQKELEEQRLRSGWLELVDWFSQAYPESGIGYYSVQLGNMGVDKLNRFCSFFYRKCIVNFPDSGDPTNGGFYGVTSQVFVYGLMVEGQSGKIGLFPMDDGEAEEILMSHQVEPKSPFQINKNAVVMKGDLKYWKKDIMETIS